MTRASSSHCLKKSSQQKWSAFNQTNISTVSRAKLGRLLRDRAERLWAFSSTKIQSWGETETETTHSRYFWLKDQNYEQAVIIKGTEIPFGVVPATFCVPSSSTQQIPHRSGTKHQKQWGNHIPNQLYPDCMAVAIDGSCKVFLERGTVEVLISNFGIKKGPGSFHQGLGFSCRIGQGMFTPEASQHTGKVLISPT